MGKAKRRGVGKGKRRSSRTVALSVTQQSGQSVSEPAPPPGQQSGPSVADSGTQQFDQSVAFSKEQRRDYLTPTEIKRLLEESEESPSWRFWSWRARWSYWRLGARDRLLILMMYRHGLRASEVIGIQLRDINLVDARLLVRRPQAGRSVEHPIPADEIKAIEGYVIEHRLPPDETGFSAFKKAPRWGWRQRLLQLEFPLFVTQRGRPLTLHGVHRIVRAAAYRAKLPDFVSPLTLRLSCGHALAANGVDLPTIQEYLGLCDLRHIQRFVQSAGRRFEGLWD